MVFIACHFPAATWMVMGPLTSWCEKGRVRLRGTKRFRPSRCRHFRPYRPFALVGGASASVGPESYGGPYIEGIDARVRPSGLAGCVGAL